MKLNNSLALLSVLVFPVYGFSDIKEENFDGYGQAEVSLEGLNGGSGFLDAYTSGGSDTQYPNYQPGVNLNFENASSGYVDRNGDTADDGHALGTATGGFNNQRLIRQISDTPVTGGTVWASYVTSYADGATDARLSFGLTETGGTSPRFGAQGTDLLSRIDDSITEGGVVDFAEKYLVIARLDINGAESSISTWLFPASVTYAETLSPDNLDTLASASSSDTGALAGVQYMGIVVGANVLVDQLRISINETVEGNKTSNTTGAVVHRGSTIDLNP